MNPAPLNVCGLSICVASYNLTLPPLGTTFFRTGYSTSTCGICIRQMGVTYCSPVTHNLFGPRTFTRANALLQVQIGNVFRPNLFDVGRHHRRIPCELCRLRLNGAVSINDNSAPRYVDDIHPVTSEELDSH